MGIKQWNAETMARLNNFADTARIAIRSLSKRLSGAMIGIKNVILLNYKIQTADPKLKHLALHHHKVKVRKKNLHRIEREYRKRIRRRT